MTVDPDFTPAHVDVGDGDAAHGCPVVACAHGGHGYIQQSAFGGGGHHGECELQDIRSGHITCRGVDAGDDPRCVGGCDTA